MDSIIQYVIEHWAAITSIGAAVGLTLNFILKRFITNENVQAYEAKMMSWGDTIQTWGIGIGKVITLGASHWRWTKPFWNSIIEPYVIIILQLLVRVLITWTRKLINGIILGLQSDKPSFKEG